MIENLKNKENDNNHDLINKLISLIERFEIKNEDDLSDLEEYFFMADDEKIDKLEFSYNKIYHDDYLFEFMEKDQIDEMNKLKDLCNSEEDTKKKLYYIIKIFDLAGYDLYFPYTTYQFIMSGKL